MLFPIVTILFCMLVSFQKDALVNGWMIQSPQSVSGRDTATRTHWTSNRSSSSSRLFGEKDKDVGGGENLYSDFALPDDVAKVGDSSVDWDAEWRKVVQKKGARERPGKDFYKSDAEIAAIRAANQATKGATQFLSSVSSSTSNFSFDSVKNDWKFWMGLLVAISFGTALLTAQVPPPPSTASSETYFI